VLVYSGTLKIKGNGMGKILSLIIVALALCYLRGTLLYAADGFTQKDRELLIELKVKMGEIDRRFEQVDKRFEQVDKRGDGIERRLERLESGMMWGFGLLFSSMLGMVGFVLWDRRSALAPAIRKSRELEEREDLIEKALREYAKIEPRFAEILKTLKM